MLDKAEYWLELCDDDLKTAKILFDNKQFLWMGFICHIIAEKAIKAMIASKIGETPSKIHKLNKLAEIGNIYTHLNESQQDLLDRLTPLQIEGRYPEYKEKISAKLTVPYCKELLAGTEEFVCWTRQRLGILPKDTQTE